MSHSGNNMKRRFLLSVFLFVLLGCYASMASPSGFARAPATPLPPGDPLSGSGDVTRTLLTADQLQQGFSYTSPVDEEALALPAEAAQPDLIFEGVLTLLGEATVGDYAIIQDDYGYANDPQRFHLPEFEFAFVQHGSHLIPAQRGRMVTEHPYWDYLLSPGRVWRENGDQGSMRAVIPFALLQKNQNCTHNGVFMFLFDETGVSKVWYQITQETCIYFKMDMWGLLDADYQPGAVADADALRFNYVDELNARLPVKPLSALQEIAPNVHLENFGAGLTPEHRTAYGLVVDDVIYLSPCYTRYGDSGYCQQMRHASFSTAKSAFAGLALMRLAQRDGLSVKDERIADHAPEAATAAGDWSQVTFENTLDMATGNYQSAIYMVDENGPTMSAFFDAETYGDKIAQAFSWPHRQPPGQQWVYHTSDTFILVRTMQNYLGSDIFDFLTSEVFQPLAVGPGAHTSARTSENNWQGQAFGGYGLWWIADDLAKLARLMQQGGKAPDGAQLLHPELVAAAMQQDRNEPGLLTGVGDRYRLGFWATRFTPDVDPAFECSFWVPYMSGAGGIVAMMLPNGMTYFYFSDNGEFVWLDAVREAHAMRSNCRFPATIARSGFDAILSWQGRGQDSSYRVWRSDKPDFMPGDMGAMMLAAMPNNDGELTYTDVGGCGDPDMNFFYRIESIGPDGARTGLTKTLGEFDYALAPGA